MYIYQTDLQIYFDIHNIMTKKLSKYYNLFKKIISINVFIRHKMVNGNDLIQFLLITHNSMCRVMLYK